MRPAAPCSSPHLVLNLREGALVSSPLHWPLARLSHGLQFPYVHSEVEGQGLVSGLGLSALLPTGVEPYLDL